MLTICLQWCGGVTLSENNSGRVLSEVCREKMTLGIIFADHKDVNRDCMAHVPNGRAYRIDLDQPLLTQ